MSKTYIVCHIVFSTKFRSNVLCEPYKHEMYKYIYGIIMNKGCKLIRMNGTENHIHILLELHPSIALADLVKDIKSWSTKWVRDNKNIPYFDGWGKEYFAESVSPDGIERCRQYIINQEVHHAHKSIEDELKEMCERIGMEFYDV